MSLKKVEREYLKHVAEELFYLSCYLPVNSIKDNVEALNNGNTEVLDKLQENSEFLTSIKERIDSLESYFRKNILQPEKDLINETKRGIFALIKDTEDLELREELWKYYKSLDE